ncbi:PEP-CTERM sorting domain-containing protein [Massilia forsythiae]|uniref:PEP-CTERM sorting domain-containing protein n=1 Tax=Massilia forsythiae TaxID=2728020 RepID=A0A7Z2ZT57_9BURK|nr:PEP-CTERM sorting domain-containing protein [Massilia forsythiae]QJE01228.1 PEP-CTERM sorting domain-containing protein [Massilia forsythiae]
MKRVFAAAVLAAASAAALASPISTTVDFSNGQQGWDAGPPFDGNQGVWIDASLGNGAPALHTVNPETFGVHWSTTGNQAFIGNYGASASVTLGIDVLANSIVYLGREVHRRLVVELRDYDDPYQDMPYTSVWYDLGEIGADKGGWQHLSVTIGDTAAAALPAGWGGYGNTVDEPSLPPGRSFADVLASVDEISFTTFVPGYFYGWTAYDIAVDNIAISADAEVPEPGSLAMLAGGLGVLAWARRRRTSGRHALERRT